MDDVATLIKAADFAAFKHRRQRRKDAEASPYINHPLALARVLKLEAGVGDVEVLVAAILHDTVEDTETTTEELAREFGPRVAAIVAEVTDDKSLPKPDRKRLQVERAPHSSPAGQAREARRQDLQPARRGGGAPRRTGRWSGGAATSNGPRRSSTACAARIPGWSASSTRPTSASPDGAAARPPAAAAGIRRGPPGTPRSRRPAWDAPGGSPAPRRSAAPAGIPVAPSFPRPPQSRAGRGRGPG